MANLLDLLVLGSALVSIVSPTYMSERNCVFPFVYKGVSYSRCTNVDMRDKKQFWCSLDRSYRGYVAFCKDAWRFEFLDSIEDLRRNQTVQQRRLDFLRNATKQEEQEIAELQRWSKRTKEDVGQLLRSATTLASDMSGLRELYKKDVETLRQRLKGISELVKKQADGMKSNSEQTERFRNRLISTMDKVSTTLKMMYRFEVERETSLKYRLFHVERLVIDLNGRVSKLHKMQMNCRSAKITTTTTSPSSFSSSPIYTSSTVSSSATNTPSIPSTLPSTTSSDSSPSSLSSTTSFDSSPSMVPTFPTPLPPDNSSPSTALPSSSAGPTLSDRALGDRRAPVTQFPSPLRDRLRTPVLMELQIERF